MFLRVARAGSISIAGVCDHLESGTEKLSELMRAYNSVSASGWTSFDSGRRVGKEFLTWKVFRSG